MKPAKMLSLVTTLSMAALTLGFAMLCYDRMQISYGPSGQYFDARSGVTFSDDAVLVYGLLAMVGCIATIWSTCWMIRVRRRGVLRRRRKNGI
ncbi:hypothetical protein C8024_09970 [Sphingopyxis sp. BSNA05]|uniref:hypothetical protein n=1 Tax=Sphingopyxis sp. BSNA05 TaxID=1236614 RepID=UPI0015671647|nr:hypothetical protein [Sphingopyxis sp. BSNA05]NRD89709.1 hypothetical protein [Sphingopyxis sp. BSNA05]